MRSNGGADEICGPLHAEDAAQDGKDLPPTDDSINMMEDDGMDESLPLELAESMAALNAFGDHDHDTNKQQQQQQQQHRNPSRSRGSGDNNNNLEEATGLYKRGGSFNDDDGDDNKVPAEIEPVIVENGDKHQTGGPVIADDPSLNRLNKSSSSSPPREKEPTMVQVSADNDDDTTNDGDAVGSEISVDGEEASTGTDDAVDVLNMDTFPAVRKQESEELIEAEPESADTDANVNTNAVAAFDGEVIEAGDLADGIERVDTDDLSGISDPINELNRCPAKSPLRDVRQEIPDALELPDRSNEDTLDAVDESSTHHEEEALQNGANANLLSNADDALQSQDTGNDEGDDDDNGAEQQKQDTPIEAERPSTPPGSSTPLETLASTPSANENTVLSSAFSGDVGKYRNGKGESSEENVAKERPRAWLSKLLSDESLISANIDADRVVMLEDTDLKPWIQEPELDGEPVFSYGSSGRKHSRAGTITAADDPAGAAAASAQNSTSIDTAPRMPLFNGQSDAGQCAVADPPGKPPLPIQEQERAPTRRVASPEPLPTPDVAPEQMTPKCEAAAKVEAKGAPKSPREQQSSLSGYKDLPPDASPLPDATPILAKGPILTRSSLRALVMKKWHTSHWVRYGPTSLLVFRSNDDFNDWLNNPYHSQRQRDYLIKARLDFYSEMKKPDVRGFKMTETKLKSYDKKGAPMHNFKLERWTNLGASLVAAFASPNLNEVEAVRDAISHSLEMCPNKGLRNIDDLLVKTLAEKTNSGSSRNLKSA